MVEEAVEALDRQGLGLVATGVDGQNAPLAVEVSEARVDELVALVGDDCVRAAVNAEDVGEEGLGHVLGGFGAERHGDCPAGKNVEAGECIAVAVAVGRGGRDDVDGEALPWPLRVGD